jgi:exoribonuclease-2
MREHGFDPAFPPQVQQQLETLAAHPPAIAVSPAVRDLRQLLWSSIDNDTSRDLDQAEVAEGLPDGTTRILIAIADVDAFVPERSPIDAHAAAATTSVYTGVRMFPMLPEALSTGATSLLEGGDKLSVVTEAVVAADGRVQAATVYRAVIRNTAQLTYSAVGAWLEGRAPAPPKVAASPELQAQLQLQDRVAQALKAERFRHGALNIETLEVRAVLTDGQLTGVANEEKNRATELIENFMIAANVAVARRLDAAGASSIRRVVRTPKRWDRLVTLAAQFGTTLPAAPDSKALNAFLTARKAADPDHFADLSLAVVKLMGPGEYVLERAGEAAIGHFGLAVEDYMHSTAPNRRFADLVTQRMLKALDAKRPAPYTDDELAGIATHCTLKEDDARKVEREMTKRISAVAMSGRIGETFDAIVTGKAPKGTFVRVLRPHIEGLLAEGQDGVDVGDRIRVRLVRTDVERGYIDFVRV